MASPLNDHRVRLAIVASHPIQYQVPIFRELARRVDVEVFFAHRASPQDQANAGFGAAFDWDIDLYSGYRHNFLRNVSSNPGTDHFTGCDTPEIYARIGPQRYDAVLVMGWHLKSMLQAAFAARFRRIPVLVRGDSHLLTVRSKTKLIAKRFAYPIGLRAFNAALFVGQRSKEYYEHYRYPLDRLFFSPHCVDTKWFAERSAGDVGAACRSRLGIGVHERVVLFAGKLLHAKRPFDLIAAAARLERLGTPVSLLIAGSGPLEDEVKRQAAVAGVSLHPLGFRNQTEMPEVYAASNVLAVPSSAETWSLVVNEALACGKPVVVSDAVGCAPDLVGDGIAGRIYPAGDCYQLAAAIEKMISSPPSLAAIAQKSKTYSVEAACEGIIRALRATCKTSYYNQGFAWPKY
jgi:glycosyltransferase involved in cell wall biosynthesis